MITTVVLIIGLSLVYLGIGFLVVRLHRDILLPHIERHDVIVAAVVILVFVTGWPALLLIKLAGLATALAMVIIFGRERAAKIRDEWS